MNNSDKTIPYRLTPAELASFRILRKKIKTFGSDQAEEEGKMAGELNIWNSDLEPLDQMDEDDIP